MRARGYMISRMKRLLPLLSLALAAPAFALPRPVVASYARGAQFEVSGYDDSKSALADFPVLVRIANDSPSGFAYSQLQSSSDGADLCFIDMNGNGLPFEIDTWDPDGTSLVWVNLPTMAQGAQFVMCWGSATSGKTVCGDNPFAGYKGVWHMNSTSPADASGSGNDGTGAGSVALVDGVVGSGLSYPDKSSYVSCGSSQAEAELTANGYTVEGWVNLAGLSGNQALFGKSGFISYRMEGTSVKITTPAVTDYGSVGNFITAANEWHYFALSFVPNTTGGAKHYMDGVLKSEQNTGGINNKTGSIEMWLARNQWGNDQGFVGLIDEYRLSPTVRSADWIAASRATQIDPAFLTAGAAQSYEASAAPDVGLVAPPSAVHYTNATLTATIGSLGKNEGMTADASWVDALLVVSRNDDLSDPVFALPLSRVSSVPVSVPVAVLPLVTNTTYYAQLRATNSFAVAGESGVASFTTHAPGAPTGTATFFTRGFTTLTASGVATDLGAGAEYATARLEASAAGFATVSSSADAAAVAGQSASFTVPNLAPDTAYALRLRIENDWGLVTTVPLAGTYFTRAAPLAATGIGYAFSAGNATVDFSFGVTEVFDDATCSATLEYDGRTVGTRSFSAPGALSWPGVASAGKPAAATVTVTATVDGAEYAQSWAVTVTPGSAAFSVTPISDHVTSATAVRLHPGDVATLPELAGTASYTVMNGRFLSLAGNVLTALEPGVAGVKCIDAAGAETTLAVLVLPEAIGSGSVYVYKETVSTGDRVWTSAAAWDKVGAETNDSWPKNADDIAVIPFYQYTDTKHLRIQEDVTLGGLYYGQFRDEKNDKLVIERHKNSTLKTVAFERTDGEPAIVRICANTTGSRQNELTFGGYAHHTEYRSDTVLDAGWDGSDNANCRGRFSASANTNTIPAGVTVTVVNFDRTGHSMGATMWPGRMEGAGVFWNRSSGSMRWDGGLENFTGTVRDSGGYKNASTDRSGPIYLRTETCTNLAVEVIGQVGRNGGSPQTEWAGSAVGCLKVGWNHGYGSEPKHPGTNWFPRAITLHGGTLQRDPNQAGVWGDGAAGGVADLRHTGRLTVEGGLNNVTGYGSDNAINWLEADELVHVGKATIRIVDQSRSQPAVVSKTNEVTVLHGVSAYLVGAAGDPKTSDVYPIVPWMVAPVTAWDDSWDRYPLFACFDEDDRLIRPVYNNTALDAAKSDKSNAYVWDKTIQIASDVTVNSLYLNNGNKNKLLGGGRTLTLTSGGLVLHNSSSAIGVPGGTDNGSLVLGDAAHPGYVFAKSGNASQPNQIWADVTAPGGFVAAYTGFLTLGGSQTNIADEIAVNAGTLSLGDATHACSLAEDLPVRVYANATLSVPHPDSLQGTILRMDGAAGWFGKVELPAGVEAQCKAAFWRDYPETPDWQELPRGVYGSSESPAAFVRDDLFTGSGTLLVGAGSRSSTMILLL